MSYMSNRLLELGFKKTLTAAEKTEMQHINEFLDSRIPHRREIKNRISRMSHQELSSFLIERVSDEEF